MDAMIIALWFACGAITARLVSLEARRERMRVNPWWYLGLLLLGPVTALTVLIVGETATILDELTY